MEKKNLNWRVPAPLADRFDELVMARWGERGKWIGAAAAMLMYLDADEKTLEKYSQLASSLQATSLPEKVKAKLSVGPKYGRSINDPKVKESKNTKN